MLSDDHGLKFSLHVVHDGKALGFEFPCGDCLHALVPDYADVVIRQNPGHTPDSHQNAATKMDQLLAGLSNLLFRGQLVDHCASQLATALYERIDQNRKNLRIWQPRNELSRQSLSGGSESLLGRLHLK